MKFINKNVVRNLATLVLAGYLSCGCNSIVNQSNWLNQEKINEKIVTLQKFAESEKKLVLDSLHDGNYSDSRMFLNHFRNMGFDVSKPLDILDEKKDLIEKAYSEQFNPKNDAQVREWYGELLKNVLAKRAEKIKPYLESYRINPESVKIFESYYKTEVKSN